MVQMLYSAAKYTFNKRLFRIKCFCFSYDVILSVVAPHEAQRSSSCWMGWDGAEGRMRLCVCHSMSPSHLASLFKGSLCAVGANSRVTQLPYRTRGERKQPVEYSFSFAADLRRRAFSLDRIENQVRALCFLKNGLTLLQADGFIFALPFFFLLLLRSRHKCRDKRRLSV